MTSRSAPTAHPVHDLIARRWSPRAFAPKPVPVETLRSVLEAARWSPSSYNEQPWRLIVATRADAAAFDRMLKCLVPKNQEWAHAAPVLMIMCFKSAFTHNNTPNRVAMYDAGAAAAQLSIEATARGLVVHQMAGIDPALCRSTYAIPEGFEPVTALALGYEGDPASLPEWARGAERAPRERKPMKDIVFADTFGKPASDIV